MSAGTERGFTLLELLVVIAIMAALTAAFPLALNRFVPARRVDAAAHTLVADIRTAQSRSLSLNQPVALEVNQHHYSVASAKPRELRASTFLELRSADGMRELPAFKVFPDGSTSGGRFVIRDGERVRVIEVSALTGRISVEKKT